MSSESSRQRLAFEPNKNRKKNKTNVKTSVKATPESGTTRPPQKAKSTPSKPTAKTTQSKATQPAKRRYTREETAIPEVVSQRMLSRMVVLAGTPLLMALGTFIGSYFIITNDLFLLPHTAVLLVSMGFFGLSVLGLSYGVLSASWDEEIQGTVLGWQEFKVNLGRMQEGWKANRQKNNKD